VLRELLDTSAQVGIPMALALGVLEVRNGAFRVVRACLDLNFYVKPR